MRTEHPIPAKGKRTRIWLIRACGILGLLLLASFAGVLSLIWLYTSPVPRELPVVQLSEREFRDLQRRLAEFQQALRQDRDPGPLKLTAEELNALIEIHPSARRLRGRLRFEIAADRLLVETTLPLTEAGQPWLARLLGGRYLNAKAQVQLHVVNGRLDVRTERLWLRQRPAPGYILHLLRRRNLVANVNDDARASMALEKLERVTLESGRLVIVPLAGGISG